MGQTEDGDDHLRRTKLYSLACLQGARLGVEHRAGYRNSRSMIQDPPCCATGGKVPAELQSRDSPVRGLDGAVEVLLAKSIGVSRRHRQRNPRASASLRTRQGRPGCVSSLSLHRERPTAQEQHRRPGQGRRRVVVSSWTVPRDWLDVQRVPVFVRPNLATSRFLRLAELGRHCTGTDRMGPAC